MFQRTGERADSVLCNGSLGPEEVFPLRKDVPDLQYVRRTGSNCQ